jgi:hypothetical protein
MSWPILIALQAGMLISVAILVRWHRAAAARAMIVLLLLGSLAIAFALPPNVYLRFISSFCAVYAGVKAAQAPAVPECWGLGMRLWHAFTIGDVLQARRVPPRIDGAMLLRILGYAVVAAVAVLALLALRRPALSLPSLLLATIFGYSAAEVIFESPRLVHRAFGWETPRMQIVPLASCSVSEFWAERWNTVMSRWLLTMVYRPVARGRRPLMALLAAFTVSALLHFALFAPPFGWRSAAIIASFFLIQALFIIAERAMRIRRWPHWIARAWTLGILLLSSPLFTYPILRATWKP